MIIGSIVTGAVGIVLFVIGYLLWKKEKLSLLHEYHYDKVSKEDKKAFCMLSGIGVLSVGIGLLLTAAILVFTESVWSFLAFAIGFAIGLTLLLYAGNKYNSKSSR